MPYPSVEDLPDAVREHLPPHAQEIYRSAFNSAWDRYADRGVERDETAHRIAWAAVKRRYRNANNEWIREGLSAILRDVGRRPDRFQNVPGDHRFLVGRNDPNRDAA